MPEAVTAPAAAPAAAVPAPDPAKTENVHEVRERRMAALRAPKVEAKPPEPAKAEEPPKVEDKTAGDDEIAALIKEDRRVKAEAKRLAEERAKLEADRAADAADRAALVKARELRTKGDIKGALQAMFPGEKLTEDFYFDLAKALGEKPAEVTPAQLVDAAVAAMEDKQAKEKAAADAKAKEQEDADKAVVHDAAVNYVNATVAEFEKGRDKYPTIARRGVSGQEIADYALANIKDGSAPTMAETLAYFETKLKKEARETLGLKDDEPAPAASQTITNASRSEVGSPPPPAGKESLEQARERRRAALRATKS